MSRLLGYCLTLGDISAWKAFAQVASVRLNTTERVSLAYATLNALTPQQAEQVASAALSASGAPLPAFLGGLHDARHWASLATKAELKAYALAAFEALSPREQTAFYRHISEVKLS